MTSDSKFPPSQAPLVSGGFTPNPGAFKAQEGRRRPAYFNHVGYARRGNHSYFDEPIEVREGESHASLVARVVQASGLPSMAAHAVALGLLGYDSSIAGERVIHTARTLGHRDTARFAPAPVRGKLDRCTSVGVFREINPSVAVNLSALKSLRFEAKLAPSDLLVLWILIGFELAGLPQPSSGGLRRSFGIQRPQDNLRNLTRASFHLEQEPTIERSRWVERAQVLIDHPNGELGVAVCPSLLELIVPKEGGENYGYVELAAIGSLTAWWQEQAYRGLVAAAVRGKVFWARGGTCEWSLTLDDARELLACAGGGTRTLTQRLLLLARTLHEVRLVDGTAVPSRVYPIRFSSVRAQKGEARPATGYALIIRAAPAAEREWPKIGTAADRTLYRENDHLAAGQTGIRRAELAVHTAVTGLDKSLSDEERRQKKSEAAKLGAERRRRHADFSKSPIFDVVSTKRPAAALADYEQMEGLVAEGIDFEALFGDFPHEGSTLGAMDPNIVSLEQVQSDRLPHWVEAEVEKLEARKRQKKLPPPPRMPNQVEIFLERLSLAIGESDAPTADGDHGPERVKILRDNVLVDEDGYIYDHDEQLQREYEALGAD